MDIYQRTEWYGRIRDAVFVELFLRFFYGRQELCGFYSFLLYLIFHGFGLPPGVGQFL